MVRGGFITLLVALTAPSLAAAQTVSFSEGAAMLGKSCGADIVANCRGVNIDTTRLKDCLYRNQDVMSAQCRADYPKALDAIQKRIAARATVGRECEYEVVKKCGGKGREVFKSLSCLLALPNTSARCTKSIADVGYRATDEVATKLSSLETPLDLDITALRAQVADRSKSRGKNEPPPQKRPPIAPELNKLPTVNMDIQFDADTPIVKPESYARLGQLADTLVNSALLPYTFLIVGHIESTGRRENNVLLSQRRADAVRDILVNTFKISSKRLHSVGLGEEQLLDANRPNAPANNQTQIMTLAKVPDEAPAATAAKGAAAAKKKPAKKR
jgi:outer membrane protein OmpA-like peptidoglycan-associated protein